MNTLTKKFNIILEQHHRAVFDAEATAYLAWKLIKDAKEMHNIDFHDSLNDYMEKATHTSVRDHSTPQFTHKRLLV